MRERENKFDLSNNRMKNKKNQTKTKWKFFHTFYSIRCCCQNKWKQNNDKIFEKQRCLWWILFQGILFFLFFCCLLSCSISLDPSFIGKNDLQIYYYWTNRPPECTHILSNCYCQLVSTQNSWMKNINSMIIIIKLLTIRSNLNEK